MEVRFISKEELDEIVASLPPDFFDPSNIMKEFEEKGITISGGIWKLK